MLARAVLHYVGRLEELSLKHVICVALGSDKLLPAVLLLPSAKDAPESS